MHKLHGGIMGVVRYFRASLAGRLPPTHRFELASQMRRAAISIPSNIAEGHAQRGDRVFLRHVRIELGSLAELETQLEIAIRSDLVDEGAARTLRVDLARTGKLLHGLRRTLRVSTALTTLRITLFFATTSGLAWFDLSA